jgi:hypothetical protein
VSSGLPIGSFGLLPFLDLMSHGSRGLLAIDEAESGLTPFDARLGRDQGRLAHGSGHAVWIGSAQDGRKYEMSAGDLVDIVRVADVTGDLLVKFSIRFTSPRGMTGGHIWRVCLLLDGEVVTSAAGWPGYERVLDLAIDVSHVSGEHEVGVRLILEAP